MLQRISGGNSGIAEYLRTGLKQGREYTRQEMDKRIVLDGDLELTNSIINSIEDKGQQRYLHITLSFYENEISEDTLKNITQDYKDLIMNAYDSSEFNFYAEAHVPTLKNMVNNSTGELIERKPHIHIVIPEKNLITDNKLSPTGMAENHYKELDAIQEHLNKKYNLASPKDGLRVSDQNHANVLSRYKGDLFKERESSVKQDIFSAIDKNNIRSTSEFEAYLKNNFKEAKTYNAGKENQYYGVKLENDSKFTRLKSPLFSKQYLENRTIPLIKPTEKQIQKGLENWKNKVSHEIKLIRPASEKLRKAYGGLNDNDKREAIQKIRENYNAKHGIAKLPEAVHRGNPFRSSENSSGRISNIKPTSRQEVGLPHLQKCGLVHGLHDRNGHNTAKSASVLPSVQVSSVAEVRRNKHSSSSVRWTQGNDRRRNLSADSSLFEAQKSHSKPSSEESLKMREIRDNINPDRFLSYCQDKFNINASKHKVTLTESGSPRFNVGNRNMNASDFLTKHINLSWQDARDHLLALDKAQKERTYYAPVLERHPLTKTEAKERFTSLNSEIKNARDTYKKEIKNLYDNYSFYLKNSVNTGNKAEKEATKILNQFYLERDKEAITQKFNHELTTIRDNHNNWISASHYEDVINNIKNSIQKPQEENQMTNKIRKAEEPELSNDYSFAEQMAKRKQDDVEFIEFTRNFNKKLTDLVPSKQGDVVRYFDKSNDNKEVFSDNGKEISFKNGSHEDIGIMMEYAERKFGGKLDLTGTAKFKEQCAIVAAEKGMNIILTPKKYHEIYQAKLAELQQQNKIEASEPEIESDISGKNVEPDISGQNFDPNPDFEIPEYMKEQIPVDFEAYTNIHYEFDTDYLNEQIENPDQFVHDFRDAVQYEYPDTNLDINHYHNANTENNFASGFSDNDQVINNLDDMSNKMINEFNQSIDQDIETPEMNNLFDDIIAEQPDVAPEITKHDVDAYLDAQATLNKAQAEFNIAKSNLDAQIGNSSVTVDPKVEAAFYEAREQLNSAQSQLDSMATPSRSDFDKDFKPQNQEISQPKITYKIPEVLVAGKDANQIVQNIKNEAEKMFQGTEIQISIEKEGGVELIGFDDDIKEIAINDIDNIINNELEKSSQSKEKEIDHDFSL